MTMSQRIVNFVNSQKDAFPAYTAVLCGMGMGGLACVAMNKAINERVLTTCNQNLNQIIYIKTAIGTSYGCVSRMVLNGPPAPIKP
jgi:hypothetical protein